MSDITTWDELEQLGELEGYDIPHYNAIDADVVASLPCENCCGECRYRGLQRQLTDRISYRAFSECSQCGRVIEF